MTTTNTKTMTEAQLYWDEQDPTNTGWWLRYTMTSSGNESGCSVEADRDATTDELAAAVTAAACSETGRIKILRDPSQQFHGWIDLEDGTATGWSAL